MIGMKITVRAAAGRTTPLPASIRRSPTGAPCIVREAPVGREPMPHELVGDVELDLLDAIAVQYVRRRVNGGDLIDVTPKAPAAAPAKRKD